MHGGVPGRRWVEIPVNGPVNFDLGVHRAACDGDGGTGIKEKGADIVSEGPREPVDKSSTSSKSKKEREAQRRKENEFSHATGRYSSTSSVRSHPRVRLHRDRAALFSASAKRETNRESNDRRRGLLHS